MGPLLILNVAWECSKSLFVNSTTSPKMATLSHTSMAFMAAAAVHFHCVACLHLPFAASLSLPLFPLMARRRFIWRHSSVEEEEAVKILPLSQTLAKRIRYYSTSTTTGHQMEKWGERHGIVGTVESKCTCFVWRNLAKSLLNNFSLS